MKEGPSGTPDLRKEGYMSRSTELLSTYVSDCLALERHMAEAFDRQTNDSSVREHAEAKPLLDKLHQVSRTHIDALDMHLRALGGHAISPVKEAVTSVLGMAAGMIDKVRPYSVSKMLRDDYTALGMAAMSYTMLHTTALALHESATADLALRHLQDWTPLIVEISEAIPFVVLRELQTNALAIDANAASEALRNTHATWTRQAMDRAA